MIIFRNNKNFLLTKDKYSLIKRTMRTTAFSLIKPKIVKTSHGILQEVTNTKNENRVLTSNYTSVAGKSYMDRENFTKKEWKYIVSKHMQIITDFNLIYKNDKEIRLYHIGDLHTKPGKNSITLSKNQNYSDQEKSQEIKFYKNPIIVKKDIHFMRKSKDFLNNKEIKKQIEEREEYKKLYNKVIEELKEKGIKVRESKEKEDYEKTGLEVLMKKNKIEENLTNPTMSKMEITETSE